MKSAKKSRKIKKLPASFRSLLWSLDWDRIGIVKDKEDIIVNTVNYGSISQWKWLKETYGEKAIVSVLKRRLASEFYPESRNLARVIFNVNHFAHVRRSARAARTKNIFTPRSI